MDSNVGWSRSVVDRVGCWGDRGSRLLAPCADVSERARGDSFWGGEDLRGTPLEFYFLPSR